MAEQGITSELNLGIFYLRHCHVSGEVLIFCPLCNDEAVHLGNGPCDG